MSPVLQLRNVSRQFGAIEALSEFSLTISKGDVVGLMGDNGAGKSTVVKIVAGNYLPSAGSIAVDNREVEFFSPVDAREAGIEVVYQDLALCSHLTAASNLFLGRERKKWFGPLRILARDEMRKAAKELLEKLGSDAKPDQLIGTMSGGQRQATAIARTLLSQPKLVLMDEPTAAISVRQVKEVLELIRSLQAQGVSILIVSHRMSDIFTVCNRIAVLRRGRKVADKLITSTSTDEVTGLITGAIESA